MEYTPEEELKSRIQRFQGSLRAQGVDGALICQNVDLFYFAGTIQESFLFIPQEGEPTLMVKKSYARAMRESALSTIIFLEKARHIPGVLRDGGFNHIGTIGLEIDELPLLGMGVNTYLEEGMVFPFEPKLIFPEKGVVGIENPYVVSSHGVEKLTSTGDQLVILPE
ncbi:MAG: aminopeptidase P family N-terminal domain-containing protein [Thermodesulfobacteriota bacterium]